MKTHMLVVFMTVMMTLLTACASHTVNQDEENEMGNARKGWSMSGTLSAFNRLKSVSLQANFTDNATNYTAQFKLMGDLIGKVTEAEIVWSVEGNQIRRIVSVADGVSIQGTGQGVTIRIIDTSPALVINPDYIVSVVVVPGTRGSTTNPPYYKPNQAYPIAAAASQSVNVPQNAGVISFRTTLGLYTAGVGPIVQDSVRVSQIDSAGNVQAITDASDSSWIPLAPGTIRILIENQHSTQVAVGVYWGIDG